MVGTSCDANDCATIHDSTSAVTQYVINWRWARMRHVGSGMQISVEGAQLLVSAPWPKKGASSRVARCDEADFVAKSDIPITLKVTSTKMQYGAMIASLGNRRLDDGGHLEQLQRRSHE